MLACKPLWAHHQPYSFQEADPLYLMLEEEAALICCHCMLQKALEQTAEKTVGLQPLVTQLSRAVHRANMQPTGDRA